MDTSRETLANGTAIRLRYSRQFESGGHAHTIDAEIALPIGAGQETREQVLRELEIGVEQLARQIVQRAARSPEGQRIQTQQPGRGTPSPLPGSNRTHETAAQRVPAAENRVLTSDQGSSGTTTTSDGKTIRLQDFINVIRKHLNLSPEEARQLLQVESLNGLNYREAFNRLQEIVKHGTNESKGGVTQHQEQFQIPGHDTARSPERPRSTNAQTPQNQATNHHAAAPTQVSTATHTITQPLTMTPDESAGTAPVPFLSLPQTPLPPSADVVRERASTYATRFDEEEDEDELDVQDQPTENTPVNETNANAQRKLEELKVLKGSSPASAERLTVLTNVVDSQINEEQFQQLIQHVWGSSGRKKLKANQVESLISWAKEDYFVEEVEAVLTLVVQKDEGE